MARSKQRWYVLAVAMLALCGIAPGDRFMAGYSLRVNGVETAVPVPALVDEHGAAARTADIGDRILTVRSVNRAAGTISFSLADSHRRYRTNVNATGSVVPGLIAIGEDREATTLNVRLGGRTVWTLGHLQAICSSGVPDRMLDVDSDVSVHIEHVARLMNFSTQFSNVGKLGGHEGYVYKVQNPILVTFRLPPALVKARRGTCDKFSARFAGTWDIERQFRLLSLRAAHPEWRAAAFAEVKASRILVGMSRGQIVAMYGYPDVPGTLATIGHLKRWFYAEPGPSGWTVYFHGDRVWAYDPPVELP